MALVSCCGLAMAMSTNEQEIGKKGDIVSAQLHQREMTFPLGQGIFNSWSLKVAFIRDRKAGTTK